MSVKGFGAAGNSVTSVSGTPNRVTVSGGLAAVVDIASNYVGQSSITTLGTITTGTWQGTKIGLAYGGTNADLSATGGTSQVLKQSSVGGAITVGTLAASDLSNGVTGSGAVVLAASPALSGSPTAPTQSSSDNSTKIASTAYVTTAVTNAVAGIDPAIAVYVATTQASDTSGLTYNNGVSGVGATLTGSVNTALTIDGQTLTSVNQRVLVKNDTQIPSGAYNGVYYLTQIQTGILPPILTRALDYNSPSNINNTGAIPVVAGTTNATTSWLLTSSVTTVGTDALTYTKFSSNPTSLLSTTLANTHIFVGNSSNIATDVAMSGDASLANTGAITIASIGGKAVSLSNSFTTSGNFAQTLTFTGITNVTFPTSGTLATTAGNVATATALQTARAIYGNNFDGTAALTQIIASTYGGTGNGFTKFSGATTSEKTYTLPDASCSILTTNAVVTAAQGGTGIANNAASTITISGNFGTTFTVSGTTSLTLPTSGTLTTLATVISTANTWSAVQTFPNSDIRLVGSSTGYTVFSSANSGASNFTLTFPAVTDTLAGITLQQSSKSAAYTTVLADAGTQILHPASDNNARTFTIDSNANVAYAVGTLITFVNLVNTLTIAITSDTMYLAGSATTGSRTLAVNGVATALKVATTTWIISGTGLT